MFRIPVLAIFLCSIISFGYAQDSVKKAHPVKPYSKYKTYKYHSYGYHRAVKPDSGAGRPAVRQIPAKPDTAAKPAVADKSLKGQYQALLTKLYRYQQPPVEELWRNVSDTLKLSKRNLTNALLKASVQNKTIDSLKSDVLAKDQSLNASNTKVDSVSLLGISTKKSTYNIIMWGLVLLLGATAAVVILRSGSYSREAKYRTKLYVELEDEFKAYKTKANDKEKKLARELQTERNKLDDLLGK